MSLMCSEHALTENTHICIILYSYHLYVNDYC